ncbi:hypothetical protein C8Q78DRAFT_1052300 [Trametes maxima]|nr:hypothetical protein C8Q78DRAFT_1052300 [Trametes maxima]
MSSESPRRPGWRGSRRPVGAGRGTRGGGLPHPGRQPELRVYQPGRRHMELIPSVSRSSGLDKDGDALRDPKVQEEYRAFIQTKVDDYWKRYPCRNVPGRGSGDRGPGPGAERHRKEMEENLLILFRKLREGLLSAQRTDAFALEVYETSLHLSVLFRSPVQTTSTLSHLFPAFYVPDAHPNPRPSASSSTTHVPHAPSHPPPASESTPHTALLSTLILLLHHLVSSYPSQLAFHTQLRQLHPGLQQLLRAPRPPSRTPSTPAASAGAGSATSSPHARHEPPSPPAEGGRHWHASASAHAWLADLARCLRRRNYARLHALAQRSAFERFVGADPEFESESTPSAALAARAAGRPANLALEAIGTLVESLVERARATAWSVLRTAYREVNLRATPIGAPSGETTAAWLARSLVLSSSFIDVRPAEGGSAPVEAVETWLEGRREKGEARRKEGEGMEGRWILVKA